MSETTDPSKFFDGLSNDMFKPFELTRDEYA